MKYSKVLFFIASILICFNSSAQTPFSQADGSCKSGSLSNLSLKKLPWYGNNEYLYDLLDSNEFHTTKYDYENALYRVPITFWVYRKKDGSEGATESEIKAMMHNLNKYNIENNTGFIYYMRPQINYINKNKRIKFGYYIEKPMMTLLHREKGCINVHVTKNIVIKRMFKHSRAIRGTYNKITQGISIRKISSPTTLTHEIGHYFGLSHTHQNYNKGKCKQEAVRRDRKFKGCLKHGLICEKSGDAICDTPAEPILAGVVNKDCVYEGNQKDKWGDSYIPATNNIMSYPTSLSCRKIFTPGQVAVMLHTAKQKSECAWDSKCNKKGKYKNQYRFDRYEPDNSIEMASYISPDSIQHHTMHKVYIGKRKNDIDSDTDWLKFEVKKDNATVTITTSKAKFQTPDTELFLYDSNKKQIANNNNGGEDTFSKITKSKLKKGIYYIQITKYKTIPSPDIGDYNLLLEIK